MKSGSTPFSLFILALAAFFIVSCAQPAVLTVTVPPEHDALWRELMAIAPPPDGVTVEPAPDGAIRIVETIGVSSHDADPQPAVIHRTWLAPTAPLWDLHAVASALSDLQPVNEIVLPDRALPVDGLYPDDPDYPLVREVALVITPPDPDAVPRRLRDGVSEWLGALRAAVDQVATVSTAPPDLVWIAGVGDIMLERGMPGLLLRDDGLDLVFSNVLPLMLEADLLLGNLEGAVSRRGRALEKGFTFRFDPLVMGPLERAGFDYLSIVNNHSYDYGEIAFLDSIDYLAASTIGTSGVGRNLAEASQPWIVSVDGTEVRVLAAGAYPIERSGFDGARSTVAGEGRPGVLWAGPRNPLAQRQMFAAMEQAFSDDSFDIVSVHGGAEWATAPDARQRELYRDLVDRGADLVLGHHSHVVQGLEAYRGRLIAYSLGNFVFPGMFVTEYGEQSVLLRIGVVDGTIRYVEPVPVTIDHQLLRLDTGTALSDRLEAATRVLAGVE